MAGNAYVVADTGGKVLLGGGLYDGHGISDCNYRARFDQSEFIAMESASPNVKQTILRHEITLTKGLHTVNGSTIDTILLQGEISCIYYNAAGTRLFEGTVIVGDASDQQRAKQHSTEAITLVNSGDPTYPV